MSGEEPVALSTKEFHALRDLLREHAGIRFDDDTAFLLQRRLQPRLHQLGLRRFIDYVDYLNNPLLPAVRRQAELQALFERVATRETYFLRERYQLDALREEILPQLMSRRRRGGGGLSLWSAGCSTGEEAYTLAITALEAGVLGIGGAESLTVLGTDLSLQALQAARAGVYGASSFRQTDDALQARYFQPVPPAAGDAAQPRWQVNAEVQRLVTFRWLNLNQSDFAEADGPHDVILCRNVLIYFDRVMRAAVIDRLARRLAPGGYLLLGHSETLLDSQHGLSLCHLRHAQVYRRPEDAAP